MPRAFLVHQKKKRRVQVLYHEHEEGCTHDDVDGASPMKRERGDYTADSPISVKQIGADSEGELHVQSDHDNSRTSPISSPEYTPKKCYLKASENSAFNKINKQSESMLTGMEYLYSKGYIPYTNPFFPTYPIPFMDYAKYGHPGFYSSNHKALDLSRVGDEALASSRLHLPYVDPRLSLTSYYQSLARMTVEANKMPTSPLNQSLAGTETFKREDVTDGRERGSNPGSPSSQKSLSPSTSSLYASQGSPQAPPSAMSVASLIASPTGPAATRLLYPYSGLNVPSYSPVSITSAPPIGRMETTLTQQPLVAGASTSSVHPVIQNYLTCSSRLPNTDKPPPLKKYKCDVCYKAFSRSNTLVTHKRIHTGDKPFKCEVCGRAFRQPGNLTRHRLTHTTAKPYVCNACNKAFNRASNLHTHMRTHTNYKPFVCSCCGKGFHQKIDMKIHAYIHTG